MAMDKHYRERFLRNIGIMNERQLLKIKETCLAIGGLGLGGSIFIDLVRMGFEKFHVADPDVYERTNINRQRLAKETTLGARKDECLLEEALAINPGVKVEVFREGVQAHNVDQFLAGADWVVDTVDVFAMNEKLLLNEKAREKGLPVASCGALGFGAAVVIFNSRTPSFKELTGLDPENSQEENMKNFLQFICPAIPSYMEEQLKKAMDRSSHIPFVAPGVEISAAFATSEIAKHILNLGDRCVAPFGIFIDPVNLQIQKFVASWKERLVQKRAA